MSLQVHLGCGRRFIPGFVHVDIADYDHIDHRHDIRSLPFFEDDSCDLLYASHVVEYFDRTEVMAVLAEWRRVLKVGGLLRLAVPDFQALAEVYRETNQLGLILGPLYGRMQPGGDGDPLVIYHKTVYDFAALSDTLSAAGFENTRRYDWRDSVHKDHDDHSQAYIPHMDKTEGRLISLNVETEKSAAALQEKP